MTDSDATCWTMIEGAASGGAVEKDAFARRYLPVLHAYLGARWRGGPHLAQDIDDACQEIVLECIREQGALSRVERDRPGGFRAYLYGVARNVARRVEQRSARNREHPAPSEVPMDGRATDEDSLSVVFDRAWARRIVRDAAREQARRAKADGPEAVRRVELLTLRFQEGLPIRDIAARWDEDTTHLHRQYALARREFQRALGEVLAFYHPGEPGRAEEEGRFLMGLLA